MFCLFENHLSMDKQYLDRYNPLVSNKAWVSAREAAEYLGITKPQILRLIYQKKINSKLNIEAPVPYYLISKVSLDKYKSTPKNKGGRPRKEKGQT